MTSTIDTIAAIKPATQQWTRGWMMSARTDERAKELGLRDAQHMWIVGRAGVLGDGDADVAAAGRRQQAEDLTNQILVPYFDVLTPAEIEDLAGLVVGIRDQIAM